MLGFSTLKWLWANSFVFSKVCQNLGFEVSHETGSGVT